MESYIPANARKSRPSGPRGSRRFTIYSCRSKGHFCSVAAHPSSKHATPAPVGSGFRPRARVEYLLRVDGMEIPFNRPRLVVGRSSTCDIQLDSPSASRQHAVIELEEKGLSVRDLGSRNGVFVNGVLIRQPLALEIGDLVRVGDHVIEIAPFGAHVEEESAELEVDVEWEEVSTRRVDPIEIVRGIVDHALARGDHEEAEGIIGGHLRVLLREVESGRPVSPHVIQAASEYALRLADCGGQGAWVDYVIALHLHARQLLALATVRELFRLAPIARYRDGRALRSYLELLVTEGRELGTDAALVLERMKRYARL
jgi:hypothetical protein